jgi:hypothetical protein
MASFAPAYCERSQDGRCWWSAARAVERAYFSRFKAKLIDRDAVRQYGDYVWLYT